MAQSNLRRSMLSSAGSSPARFISMSSAAPDEDIQALFYKWNDALATLDSSTVAGLYAPDAVLLPTVSDTPRTSPEAIQAYFDSFLKSKPQGIILQCSGIHKGPGWAHDAGIYEFTMGIDGSKVQARYSFLYTMQEESGMWKIAQHHSSILPEAALAALKAAK